MILRKKALFAWLDIEKTSVMCYRINTIWTNVYMKELWEGGINGEK